MVTAFDYTTRTAEAQRIITAAPKALQSVFNALQNFYYDVSWPLQDNRHAGKVGVEKVRREISVRAVYSDEYMIDRSLSDAGVISQKDSILRAGLHAVFDVATERYKEGSLIGNGHDARQEAAANAVIAAHRVLMKL